MTLTPQIVNSTLSLNTTFTVGHIGASHPDTLVITDASVWTNIVSASTDQVNIILQILDPAGQPIYQNTGWNTNVYTSPDLFFGTSPVVATPSITLFYDTNGNLITGAFSVNAKVQVIQNFASSPIDTLGTGATTPVLNSAYLQANLCVKMSFAPNYMNANMTVADITNYGSYASITRLITVTPPVEANQSPFTNASNSVLVTGLWAPAPYQGELNNIVTYVSGSTATVSYIIYFQNFITDNTLNFCDLYCCLKQLWVQRAALLGSHTPFYNQLTNRIQAGLNILGMCYEAAACSDEATIQGYIQQFYTATGCSPDGCGCGCNDTPTAVVPISPTQGPAGVSVVSASVSSGNLILTLSNSTTINAGALPTGAAGTNGTNGASLLWPPFVLPPFSYNGSSGTNFVSNTILANSFQNVGDSVNLRINLIVPQQGQGFIEMTIGNTGGSPVAINIPVQAISVNTQFCAAEVYIEYIGLVASVPTVQVGVSHNYGRPSNTIAVGWVSEVGVITYNAAPLQYAYNPTIDGQFVLAFVNATATCGVSFIEAVLKKVP